MGEWAPLGPAADPVERPLVLVERGGGVLSPGPQAEVDTIPTYTYTHQLESTPSAVATTRTPVNSTWRKRDGNRIQRKKETVDLDFRISSRKFLSWNPILAKAQEVPMPAGSMSEKLNDPKKSSSRGKQHVTRL